MMNIQVTVANLLVMWVSATTLASLILFRSLDMWRAGDVIGARIRLGFGLFLIAVGLEYFWWLLRWMLLDANLQTLSRWFVDNAWLTLWAGLLATIGVAISIASLLWPAMRWQGIAIAAIGVAATWSVGFTI